MSSQTGPSILVRPHPISLTLLSYNCLVALIASWNYLRMHFLIFWPMLHSTPTRMQVMRALHPHSQCSPRNRPWMLGVQCLPGIRCQHSCGIWWEGDMTHCSLKEAQEMHLWLQNVRHFMQSQEMEMTLLRKRMKNNEGPKFLTLLPKVASDYLLWLVIPTAQINVSIHILTSLINLLVCVCFLNIDLA